MNVDPSQPPTLDSCPRAHASHRARSRSPGYAADGAADVDAVSVRAQPTRTAQALLQEARLGTRARMRVLSGHLHDDTDPHAGPQVHTQTRICAVHHLGSQGR